MDQSCCKDKRKRDRYTFFRAVSLSHLYDFPPNAPSYSSFFLFLSVPLQKNATYEQAKTHQPDPELPERNGCGRQQRLCLHQPRNGHRQQHVRDEQPVLPCRPTLPHQRNAYPERPQRQRPYVRQPDGIYHQRTYHRAHPAQRPVTDSGHQRRLRHSGTGCRQQFHPNSATQHPNGLAYPTGFLPGQPCGGMAADGHFLLADMGRRTPAALPS